MEIRCKKCGSTKVFTDTKGNQTGIYCSECGKWVKWATKDEIRLIDHNSTSDAKLTVDAIAELQAENEKLKNKLEKIEQIVKKELSPLSLDEISNAEIQIRTVLEQE